MRVARCFLAMLILVLAATAASGCQQIRRQLGIRTTIDNPEPGSPESVVRDILTAAIEDDEAKAWQAYRELLHSEQLQSAVSENTWRTMNFPSLRRKARLYLEDDTKPVYQLAYTEDVAPDGRKLFVYNEKSEVPTPCTLKPDPKREGSWRVTLCSL